MRNVNKHVWWLRFPIMGLTSKKWKKVVKKKAKKDLK